MLVEGKIAMVTGAGGGIGAGCARALAAQGARRLYLVDLDAEKGRRVAEALKDGCDCRFYRMDVSDETAARALFQELEAGPGAPEILVNCAGVNSVEPLFEMELSAWDRLMDINLKSVLIYSRQALLRMQKRKYGRIVSVSSIAGQVGGIRTSPAYAVSKAGIICLTKSLAKAFAAEGITVNCVAPGLVDTEMVRIPGFQYSTGEIPMGHAASPSEIADAVLFLASDLGRYVTGQCLGVNGGMHLG